MDSHLYDEPPPSYDVAVSGDCMEVSTLYIADDGRVDVTVVAKQAGLSDLLPSNLPLETRPLPDVPPSAITPLNIVIQIVGSRGDVQPFIALGTRLQKNGHRVRLATHENFRDFVHAAGVGFYPIGGNPEELMSFMVKNPGIIPKMSTIAGGEIGRKRQMISEMLDGCWQSCVEPDPETKIPFVADAIIANPPSFAHIHCAQALSVPLHMMFTMPWSPTKEFPHPLANVKGSGTDASLRNYMSYSMVELLTWSGLADIINQWRAKALNLEELSPRTAAGLMEAMQIPHTYCWSPALIPKPLDWPSYIDVCGFFFRDEPLYTSPEIQEFINRGSMPVYIGFGSIVMDDPAAMTAMIQGACQELGIRAIVSKGWSKLGQGCNDPNILFIEDCPHEWLFKHVAAVVHHGGAGTTACGLLNGCPTAIVPFFGDQPFWAKMVAAAGAGPSPIDHNVLTVKQLSEAIAFCLTRNAQQAAASIAARMKSEDGVSNAAASFHRHIPWKDVKCDLLPSEAAAWLVDKKRGLKLSHKAMVILSQHKQIDMQHLKPYRAKEMRIEKKYTDPFSSPSAAVLNTMIDFTVGLGRLSTSPTKGMTQMTSSLVKGTLVDAPTALAEGLRNVPRLYGEKPEKPVPMEGWKSGMTHAGKSLYIGFADGLTGFVTKPYREAKTDGAAGFAKGFAKGSVELFSKPGAAMFGLTAYPAMGIYKSIKKGNLNPTERKILEAQIELGDYMLQSFPASPGEIEMVLSKFSALS
ncbi:sterol glucosyltransferase [Aspergillus arachidicola]|uniref:Sterol glucosyltransferase n=1 Tax=Aspergillus arachidicola TaxID=656916 RepID=A0A2G7FKS7_9EURO|nr:sterol glucosyltransferase [Aspergillus arachidicola]